MSLVGALLAPEIDFRVAPAEAGGGGASPSAALGLKLFIDAQASISVPSTLKWSVDRSRFILALQLQSHLDMGPSGRGLMSPSPQ
jgi:hypothetical protein